MCPIDLLIDVSRPIYVSLHSAGEISAGRTRRISEIGGKLESGSWAWDEDGMDAGREIAMRGTQDSRCANSDLKFRL